MGPGAQRGGAGFEEEGVGGGAGGRRELLFQKGAQLGAESREAPRLEDPFEGRAAGQQFPQAGRGIGVEQAFQVDGALVVEAQGFEKKTGGTVQGLPQTGGIGGGDQGVEVGGEVQAGEGRQVVGLLHVPRGTFAGGAASAAVSAFMCACGWG